MRVRACVRVCAPWCFAGPLRRSLSPVALDQCRVRRPCSCSPECGLAWRTPGPPLPHSSLLHPHCCVFAGGFSCRPYRRCNAPHSRVCRCADGVPCATGYAFPRPGMDQQFGRTLTTSAPPPHMSAPHGFVPESRYPTGPVRHSVRHSSAVTGVAPRRCWNKSCPTKLFPGILRARLHLLPLWPVHVTFFAVLWLFCC